MIYIAVFILLLIPVIKYDILAETGGEKIWIAVNFAALVLLAGLRYRVGGDTLMYMALFDECPHLDELRYFDFENATYNPAWYVLNALCKSVSDSFAFFQIVHAVFVNSVFFWFFRKYCPMYYFSVIALYYFSYFGYFNMEILRESICVCFFILATDSLLSRHWLRYSLFCIMALLFHYSAAILFLLPFVYLFKRNLTVWAVFFFALTFVAMVLIDIPAIVMGFFHTDSNQLYFLIEKYLDDQLNMFGMIDVFIKFLPLILILFLYEKNSIKLEYNFLPLVLACAAIYGASMKLGICIRFYNYLIPYMLILIVNAFYRILSNLNFRAFQVSYGILGISLFFLLFNYTYYYVRDMSDVYPNTKFVQIFYPYHSVLNPVRDDHRENFLENYRDVAIMF